MLVQTRQVREKKLAIKDTATLASIPRSSRPDFLLLCIEEQKVYALLHHQTPAYLLQPAPKVGRTVSKYAVGLLIVVGAKVA